MSKPDNTCIIATSIFAWGVGKQTDDAIFNMLSQVSYSDIERLAKASKKLELELYEASNDVVVYENSVRAVYLKDYGKAELAPKLVEQIKDIQRHLEDAVEHA